MTIIDDLHRYFTIDLFIYNKEILNYKSINTFNLTERRSNDENNKIRECIVGAIINNKVPENYYIIKKWCDFKKNIFNFLEKLNCKAYVKVECIHKAGRKNNYDFLIKIHEHHDIIQEYHLELKFNASSIDDAPQFVSPMKPSQYMSASYEKFYYDNFLQQLATFYELPMPKQDEYMTQIHNDKPKCMKLFQDLYYRGCKKSSKFTNNSKDIECYEYAKNVSNNSISSFINYADLNIEMLSNYLYNTQKDKIYMLYSCTTKRFILQKIDINDYNIVSVIKNPQKSRYECMTKTGKKINILLRWKNGNGIAFPAFQIS